MSSLAEAPHVFTRIPTRTVALQFDGSPEGWERVVAFAGDFAQKNEFDHYWINSPSGPNTLTKGDWIGRAAPDDFYVIGDENFRRLYDLGSAMRAPPMQLP